MRRSLVLFIQGKTISARPNVKPLCMVGLRPGCKRNRSAVYNVLLAISTGEYPTGGFPQPQCLFTPSAQNHIMTPISFIFTFLLCALTCSARAVDHMASILPRAGTLEQVTDYGDNPTNVDMYIYVPTNLAANPGIIVAIHYCMCLSQ